MKIEDWQIIKEALQEKLIRSTSERVDAQIGFTLMAVEVELGIAEQHLKRLSIFSRRECIWNYCPHPDKCNNQCLNPNKLDQ